MNDIEEVKPINMDGARLLLVAQTEDGTEVTLTLKRLKNRDGRMDLIHRLRYPEVKDKGLPVETWRVLIDCELEADEDEPGVLYTLQVDPPVEHDTTTFEGLVE